jgi:DNA end-binding protein Ku
MPRVIWKGAISFGLVHVPVALYPAASESGVDFDWLDRRTMDLVGYRRVNKRTGQEIDRADIVKGVKVDGGDYVVLGDDEIQAAYPRTTQTIEIESFVAAGELPFALFEKPYVLEPSGRGEKVYVLLREAMRAAGVVGIARVVMHSKEHLAALIPDARALMLYTLRWAADLRPLDELELPAEGRKGAALKEGELKMAQQLIGDMTERFDPARYSDRFADAVRALVERRAAAGRTERVEPLEEAAPAAGNVVDLTALLKRSLGQRKGAKAARDEGAAPAGERRARAAASGAREGAAGTPARRGPREPAAADEPPKHRGGRARSAKPRTGPSAKAAPAGKAASPSRGKPAAKAAPARKAAPQRTPARKETARAAAPAERRTASERRRA